MRTNFISAAILIAASSFSAQATATTTIGIQDYSGTLIDNKWQDVTIDLSAHGLGMVTTRSQTATPYSTSTADGLGTLTLSPIVNFNDNSHIHVSGGDGNTSTATTPFIHGDVGGVFIDGSGSYDTFSFQSMDILQSVLQSDTLGHPNATITVRGFLGGTNNMMTGATEADGVTMQYNGGSQVATATLFDGVTGTFDFLAADAGFGEVDYVEFFFTDFYRMKPSSMGDGALNFEFDNIVVSAVPVPAAAWLFGTGIMGLMSFARKKQQAITT